MRFAIRHNISVPGCSLQQAFVYIITIGKEIQRKEISFKLIPGSAIEYSIGMERVRSPVHQCMAQFVCNDDIYFSLVELVVYDDGFPPDRPHQIPSDFVRQLRIGHGNAKHRCNFKRIGRTSLLYEIFDAQFYIFSYHRRHHLFFRVVFFAFVCLFGHIKGELQGLNNHGSFIIGEIVCISVEYDFGLL